MYLLCIAQLFSILFGGGMPAVFHNSTDKPGASEFEKCEIRANLLAGSYYNNCYFPLPNKLIMVVGWNDTASSCWEYGALFSLTVKMAALDSGYLKKCEKVIDGLQYYRHDNADGSFGGYAVTRANKKGGADSGIAYDDNMWLCRDFVALYELTGNKKHLDYATQIADFIIASGYTDLDPQVLHDYGFDIPQGVQVGGFYWDSRHDALHTCSNGPAVQCLAALYRLTGKEEYLSHAEKAYTFLKYLENADGVFYDLMAFEKDDSNNITGVMGLAEDFYSYNSGSPITAAVELYRVKGSKEYLVDASRWANCADRFFAKDSASGVKSYPGSNVWFNMILLNGFCALAPYDPACKGYIENIGKSIDFAYDNYLYERAELFGGTFIPRDWTAGYTDDWGGDFNSINVSANAEIYATLAIYYK